MNRERPPITLEVRVDARPRAGLLRAAIACRLAGRPFVAGPEDAVGAAVARAVDEAHARKRRWR
jgi:hypothetical protein